MTGKLASSANAARAIKFDLNLLREFPRGVVGVDEVGRGCLAGPVIAGVFLGFPVLFEESNNRELSEMALTDSKALRADRRNILYHRLIQWRKHGLCDFAVGGASVGEIENFNILEATKLAMERALLKLLKRNSHISISGPMLPQRGLFEDDKIDLSKRVLLLVDGRPLKNFPWEHQAVVKGDANSFVIGAASIIAKVVRDRLMKLVDGRYPSYGFAQNKGYGTAVHLQALRAGGLTPIHRKAFCQTALKV